MMVSPIIIFLALITLWNICLGQWWGSYFSIKISLELREKPSWYLTVVELELPQLPCPAINLFSCSGPTLLLAVTSQPQFSSQHHLAPRELLLFPFSCCIWAASSGRRQSSAGGSSFLCRKLLCVEVETVGIGTAGQAQAQGRRRKGKS